MRRHQVAWMCALIVGCGTGAAPPPGQQGDRTARQREGRPVATVDGAPIFAEEVREAARRLGLPPEEALARLEAELLLAGEAARRGFAAHPEVALVARRAAVQALLRAEVEAGEVPQEAIRRAYAEHAARFDRPERRASVHLLVRLEGRPAPEVEARAEAQARRWLPTLREAWSRGPEAVDALLARHTGTRAAGLAVVAERVPPRPQKALDAAYADALFTLDAPGVYPEPVRSRYGWHVLALTDLRPAEKVSLEEAAPKLREELTMEARQARLARLLERLEADMAVTRHGQAIEAACRTRGLLDTEGS